MNQLKFKRLHTDAIIPTRANPLDAGVDIYALEDVVIPETKTRHWQGFKTSIGQARIHTGIAVEIPPGHYGKVSSRSGLAFKQGIFSFDGTIDSLYRGEVGVLLYNTTDKPYQVCKGDRVAQLIVVPCAILEPVEVADLSDTERGISGFGSSGR